MEHKVAVLLDGGFVTKRIQYLTKKTSPTAADVLKFAHKCVFDGEELFRVYYYDCPPWGGTLVNPIDKTSVDFSKTPQFQARNQFLNDLAVANHLAVRRGELKCSGWRIKSFAARQMMKTGRAMNAGDLEPDFRQKRVDTKIGLDVAWLASKHIVDAIILVSGDSDFAPALKFARREGVRVITVPMEASTFPASLREHADEVRDVSP
ncbi:MAG TPA: NYN domain-containing protein [Coriobacteriia bacterium]